MSRRAVPRNNTNTAVTVPQGQSQCPAPVVAHHQMSPRGVLPPSGASQRPSVHQQSHVLMHSAGSVVQQVSTGISRPMVSTHAVHAPAQAPVANHARARSPIRVTQLAHEPSAKGAHAPATTLRYYALQMSQQSAVRPVQAACDAPGVSLRTTQTIGKPIEVLVETEGASKRVSTPLAEEIVPGLRAFFDAAKLQPYYAAAHAWCADVGAVEMPEVFEALDDLSEALELKVIERRRLRRMADHWQADTDDSPASARGSVVSSTVASVQTQNVQTMDTMHIKDGVRAGGVAEGAEQDDQQEQEGREARSSAEASVAVRNEEAQERLEPHPSGEVVVVEQFDLSNKAADSEGDCNRVESRSALCLESLEIPPSPVQNCLEESLIPAAQEQLSDTATREPRTSDRAAALDLPAAPRPPPSPLQCLPVYGLDAELQARAAAKYDSTAEMEAACWVSQITGVRVIGDFANVLRDGQVLCELANSIRPGIVAKVNQPGKPFRERENISNFITACRSLGVHEYALFSTDDLYDKKNIMSVIKCIHALGGTIQRTVPEFRGPRLGIADTSHAKRDSRRDMAPVTQTGGLHAAMERSHLDLTSGQIVRGGNLGGS